MSDTVESPRGVGWVFKTFFFMAVGGTVLAICGAGAVYWRFSRDLPNIITVADYRPSTVTRVIASGEAGQSTGDAREGKVIGEFFKERRYVIPYEKIPEVLVRAFISAEDDKFFEHPGINVASIIRAGIANFRAGHVVQGGSTITQQVAKSLLLTPERSFGRKIREVILASRIERNLTKQQILYLYLNQIYLGHGAYGVQAASQMYYRKDISQITLAEAAILAGMPQAPGKYSPLLNPKRAKERQLYVLRRMAENGYITQAQLAAAAGQTVKVYPDEETNVKYAAYLVEHIRRHLVEKFGEKAVYEDGLTVTVPTSPALAMAASKSLQDGLRTVDKRLGYRGPRRKLTGETEIEKFLRDSRLTLIDRKLGYRLLTPDGRIDPFEDLKQLGIVRDSQLLTDGEVYEAAVTSVDDKRKVTGVMIGGARGELPLEKMRWARVVRDEKNPQAPRPEPAVPSRVFNKGDVIWVRIDKVTDSGFLASLEQEPQVQGAIFSMQVRTGYVLAMEGGFDYKASEFNRALQAQRQPGSAFKPIIYSAALEKGFTPVSILVDAPIVYEEGEAGKWKPNNFEEKFYGDTTFRQALIKSRNIPTIRILQSIQIPYLIDYAKRLGMTGQMSPDLSIALGSSTISLVDLTRIYALYPRLGRRATPIFLTQVMDRDGKVLEEQKSQPLLPMASPTPQTAPSPLASASPTPLQLIPQGDVEQILDPRVAFVMTHLMKEVVNYGTGHEAKNLGRAAAGKTGTTSDYLDAWFMGFTPDVVTGVWVGFDNQRAIGPGETGARAALPIWVNYMKEAVKPYASDSDFMVPPGIVFASIDPATGKLAPSNSSTSIKEAFIDGTQPSDSAVKGGGSNESPADFFKEDSE